MFMLNDEVCIKRGNICGPHVVFFDGFNILQEHVIPKREKLGPNPAPGPSGHQRGGGEGGGTTRKTTNEALLQNDCLHLLQIIWFRFMIHHFLALCLRSDSPC